MLNVALLVHKLNILTLQHFVFFMLRASEGERQSLIKSLPSQRFRNTKLATIS